MCGLNDNTFLMCHIEGVIIHSSAGLFALLLPALFTYTHGVMYVWMVHG